MKRYRTFFIVTLILLFVGIPILLSAADQRITPPGVAFDYKARELKAPPHIVSKLTQLRSQIATQKLSFKVGYTEVMDFDLKKLAALKVPTNFAQMVNSQNVVALRRLKNLPVIAPVCSTTASSFDWRKFEGSTPVKNQGYYCGSCWDFALIGAFEGSWRIINNETIDASEQDVLDCSRRGSCGGGWQDAFEYLVEKGVAGEASYPYQGRDQTCKTSVARPYKADTWGFVGTNDNIPSVTAIKQALCTLGPLWVAVRATDAFKAYVSGVFDEHASGGINHAVTLIGWDDSKKAWLIKNSWGAGWGDTCGYGTERGYIWISYTSNKIGYGAAWVKAHGKIALKSMANGKYVSVDNGAEKSLIANLARVDIDAAFDMVNMGASLIALKSTANGKFVCAEDSGAKALIANRNAIGPWETFEMVDIGAGKIALKSMANGKLVCAGNGGAKALIANRTTAGSWETFEKIDMGAGKIALKSTANGKLVSVDNGAAKALIANLASVGPAATFEITTVGADRIALKSRANGKFVSAEDGGAKALIANRTTAGPLETFEVVNMGAGKIALKSRANGKFVCAENAGAAPLIANRTKAVPMGWETFEMFNAPY
jgi:cathepsin L